MYLSPKLVYVYLEAESVRCLVRRWILLLFLESVAVRGMRDGPANADAKKVLLYHHRDVTLTRRSVAGSTKGSVKEVDWFHCTYLTGNRVSCASLTLFLCRPLPVAFVSLCLSPGTLYLDSTTGNQ